jgi:hypothetical protein
MGRSGTRLREERLDIPGSRKLATIVDGLVDPAATATLFKAYRALPYRYLDADVPEKLDILHLVHSFSEEDARSHPLCAPLVDVAASYLAARGLRHRGLGRAYANFNLFGDLQRAHDDGRYWTVLFFVNDTWEEDWGGETLFYGPKSAAAVAVPPRPGRAIVFDGELRHRGGVPSKLCLVPRITAALKFRR